MNYSNLIDSFTEKIPTYLQLYQNSIEKDIIDKDSGIHVIFGMVFVPYIINSLENNVDEEILIETFNFFEEMSLCEDIKVVEVLDFTVLEQLIDKGKIILEKAKVFMGINTKLNCEKIEEYFIIN